MMRETRETYVCKASLAGLKDETLFEILEELAKVQEGNLCTVRIGIDDAREEHYLYGVWEMAPGEYERDKSAWSYYLPEHYVREIEEELGRRGLVTQNVRTEKEELMFLRIVDNYGDAGKKLFGEFNLDPGTVAEVIEEEVEFIICVDDELGRKILSHDWRGELRVYPY